MPIKLRPHLLTSTLRTPIPRSVGLNAFSTTSRIQKGPHHYTTKYSVNSYTYNSYLDQRISIHDKGSNADSSGGLFALLSKYIRNPSYSNAFLATIAAASGAAIAVYFYKNTVQPSIMKMNQLQHEFTATDTRTIGSLHKMSNYKVSTNFKILKTPTESFFTTRSDTQFIVVKGPPGTGKSLFCDQYLQLSLSELSYESQNLSFKQREPWLAVKVKLDDFNSATCESSNELNSTDKKMQRTILEDDLTKKVIPFLDERVKELVIAGDNIKNLIPAKDKFQPFKSLPKIAKLPKERQLSKLIDYLARRPGWILYLDGCSDYESVRHLIPRTGGSVIITTTNPDLDVPDCQVVRFDYLSTEASLQFLQSKLVMQPSCDYDEKILREIATKLDGSPLALSQAVKILNRGVMSFATFNNSLNTELLDTLSKGKTSDDHASYAKMALTQIQQIRKLSPQEAVHLPCRLNTEELILFVITTLGGKNISRDMLVKIMMQLGIKLLTVDSAMQNLLSMGILTKQYSNDLPGGNEQAVFSVHGLMVSALKKHFASECRKAQASDAERVSMDSQGDEKNYTLIELIVNTARESFQQGTNLAGKSVEHTESSPLSKNFKLVNLYHSVGKFYEDAGDVEAAKTYYEKALLMLELNRYRVLQDKRSFETTKSIWEVFLHPNAPRGVDTKKKREFQQCYDLKYDAIQQDKQSVIVAMREEKIG